ncbi:hypothetical protein C2S52_002774 [Perilla frutescens var. hirtella]|nr:hypothetical protein C2S52_002774 [Perilla frutescens var. hirtella]
MKRAKSENDGGDENLRQPYLSGAYIRSFVKQLTSSRSMREKTSTVEREEPQQHEQPQQHKKQVRRRLQTRKPYQEKLLNMAEARREIVSALKLHRATMKQANENHHHQQREIKSASDFTTEQKSRRNPRIYASNTDVNFADNNAVYSPACFYSWPAIPSAPPPPAVFQENVDFALPSQALGLNLNLQDFITGPSSIYSSSSPSTSSSPPPPPPPPAERFGFLNCLEMIKGEDEREEEMVSSPFDEVMEFPAWLNANESCLQHVDEFCAHDFFQNPVLPCMEIEEIEGMDGDWLA